MTDDLSKILQQAVGGIKSYTKFEKLEDVNQIPYHEEMGPINSTILKSADGTFIIDASKINPMGVATYKMIKQASQAMIQKN